LKSLRDGKTLIGSVLFCDTIYLQNGLYYNMTESVPSVRFFNANGHISYLWDKVASYSCGSLGSKQIDYTENIYMYCPPHSFMADKNMEIEAYKIKLKVYEKGFKIYSDAIGLQHLECSDITAAVFIKNNLKPILILKLKEPLVFNSVSINEICLFFVGSSVNAVYLKLEKFFEQNQIQTSTTEIIPTYLLNSEDLPEKKLIKREHEKISVKGSKILDQGMLFQYLEFQQILKMNNLKELTFKLFNKIVKSKDEETKKEETKKDDASTKKKIDFIFVNGPFNAGKRKFGESLQRFEGEFGCKILAFNKRFIELPGIDEQGFVHEMMDLVQRSKLKGGDQVVAVIPSILNTKVIVDGLLLMPEFTEFCSVKAVITKINLNNLLQSQHKEIFEHFLLSCSAGYSQFIIFDHLGINEKELEIYFANFREMFPFSKVYRTSNNILDVNIARDILNYKEFDAKINKLERKRTINITGAAKEYLFVPFKIPIVRQRLEQDFWRNFFHKDKGFIYKQINIDASQINEKDEGVAADLLKVKVMIEKINQELEVKVPHLYTIKGYVRFDGELKDGIFEVTINSNYIIVRPLKNVKTHLKSGDKEPEPSEIHYENFDINELGFLFYGENITGNKPAVVAILKDLIRPMKEKKKLLTKESISPEKMYELEIENRGWGLEDGVYFDGRYFKDWDGNILAHHPRRDELIEKYLAEENSKIGTYNRQIEKEWKLFEQSWNK